MPKLRKQKRTKYSIEDIQKAVIEVRNKQMSYRKASKRYGVPLSTIKDHVRSEKGIGKVGRPTVFPPEVKQQFEEKIKKAAKMGFGIT